MRVRPGQAHPFGGLIARVRLPSGTACRAFMRRSPLIWLAPLLFVSACNCGGRLSYSGSRLSAEPTSLNFGTLAPGERKELTLLIRAVGSAPVAITQVTVAGDARTTFTVVDTFPGSISGGDEASVRVRYAAPLDPGSDVATLLIETDSEAAPELAIPLLGSVQSAVLSCGDGQVDTGETCDPPSSCPGMCPDDGDQCTAELFAGHPSTCNASCRHVRITSCLDGDGCCAMGCTRQNDSDCVPASNDMHDAGVPDAGSPRDAGTPPRDAGMPPRDAGVSATCNHNGTCEPTEACWSCPDDCGTATTPATVHATPQTSSGYVEYTYSPAFSCDPELIVASVYEAVNGVVTVQVDRTSPMVLVLTAYEAVDWQVTFGPNTQVQQIVISGYEPQTITAPSGVTVVNHSPYVSHWLGCGYSYPYNGGGCDTDMLFRKIETSTQMSLSHFAGTYAGTSFTIQ